ncbi:MAG TPA: type II toxin-antitoxin system VapC family toxin [Gemmataceae bacterium]
MNLLLDTHAVLWWLDDPARLAPQARAAIEEPENLVFVSAAVAWEMSIKHAAGKLRCPDDLESVMEQNSFRPLPVSIRHALNAGALPPHHNDPFDRLLVAQAQAEGLTLVTRDPTMPAYGVAILAA